MKALFPLLFAVSLFAQSDRPNLTNARIEPRAFQGDLKRQIASSSPAWFGYAVKTTRRDHENCCWNGQGQCGCRLEGTGSGTGTVSSQSPIPLEGSDRIAVLIRVDSAGITKIQSYSLACPLDGGGLPFIWIENVPAAASLSFLSDAVHSYTTDRPIDGAILAVAQHDDPQADALLERFTRSSEPEKVREKSIFWLGAARGSRGVPVLKNLLAHDSSERIRDKAVFALHVSKQPEATDAILQAAKTDTSSHVRGQALFWLAQKAGERATSAIVDAINNDPDTDVKKRAVFALSQLPKDEGVPKLIQVATDQRNPQVRKQAFFWLGQSKDPRALAFLEQVLTK